MCWKLYLLILIIAYSHWRSLTHQTSNHMPRLDCPSVSAETRSVQGESAAPDASVKLACHGMGGSASSVRGAGTESRHYWKGEKRGGAGPGAGGSGKGLAKKMGRRNWSTGSPNPLQEAKLHHETLELIQRFTQRRGGSQSASYGGWGSLGRGNPYRNL